MGGCMTVLYSVPEASAGNGNDNGTCAAGTKTPCNPAIYTAFVTNF